MKNTAAFLRVTSYLLACLLLAGTAAAQKPPLSAQTGVEAFVAPPAAPVPLVDLHGFEPAEGFAPGFLGGQAGWTAFIFSAVEPTIDTVNPARGSQHMQISGDPALPAPSNVGGFSPDLGPQDVTKPSLVSVDVSIGGLGGADYDVAPQAPSQGFLTTRVKFFFLGDILILDDLGGGPTFVDSGVDFPVGTYFNLRIEIDPVADTIDYFIDGALIYSSVGGVFLSTQVEQVVILSDNFNAGESGDFDNLLIDTVALQIVEIPTLGQFGLGLLLLSLIGAGIYRIRRRR